MVTRPLTALAGFVAAQAAMSLNPANALELYTIEGYMDRTLSQAQVISRSEASSSKTRRGTCSSRRAKGLELNIAAWWWCRCSRPSDRTRSSRRTNAAR